MLRLHFQSSQYGTAAHTQTVRTAHQCERKEIFNSVKEGLSCRNKEVIQYYTSIIQNNIFTLKMVEEIFSENLVSHQPTRLH